MPEYRNSRRSRSRERDRRPYERNPRDSSGYGRDQRHWRDERDRDRDRKWHGGAGATPDEWDRIRRRRSSPPYIRRGVASSRYEDRGRYHHRDDERWGRWSESNPPPGHDADMERGGGGGGGRGARGGWGRGGMGFGRGRYPMRWRGGGPSPRGRGGGFQEQMRDIDYLNPEDVPRNSRYFLHDNRMDNDPRLRGNRRHSAGASHYSSGGFGGGGGGRDTSPVSWGHDKFDQLREEEEAEAATKAKQEAEAAETTKTTTDESGAQGEKDKSMEVLDEVVGSQKTNPTPNDEQ